MEREPFRPGHVEPLWDRIDRNRVKMAWLVSAFTLAWAVAAELIVVLPISLLAWLFTVGELRLWVPMAFGGAVALVVAALWVWRSLSRSERGLLLRLGATRVPLGELPDTKRSLHEMSIAVGLKFPPPLHVLDTTAVNAFILGRTPEKLAIGVTSGMLKLLGPDEHRAVFANLLARYRDGDTQLATVASALMSPVWAWRERDLRASEDEMIRAVEIEAEDDVGNAGALESPALLILPFYLLAVVVTEFLYYGQMEQHILTSEAADAKGMLLLKEPTCMLEALEHALPEDNFIGQAGSAMAPLFFCWTGDAPYGTDDPEFRRVARLRETLGVAGQAEIADARLAEYLPPRAPRIAPAEPATVAPPTEPAAERPMALRIADENPEVLREADAAPGPPKTGPGSAEQGPDFQ